LLRDEAISCSLSGDKLTRWQPMAAPLAPWLLEHPTAAARSSQKHEARAKARSGNGLAQRDEHWLVLLKVSRDAAVLHAQEG
jgi:hypothetical protein